MLAASRVASRRPAGALAGFRATGIAIEKKMAAARPSAGTAHRPSSTQAADPNTIKVFVNGVETRMMKGGTVLQGCEAAGIHVPRFCYHDRLSVAGNCRMCLVEVEKSPKPVASCAMPAMEGMKIKTNTPLVLKAREGVMEFLLANHPLDCPICDQGGECDLQDQSMAFGSDRGRFREWKRSVEDKNLGPLVKTVMTRCIHCTRCVRFSKEIAGVGDLGVTGRGNGMEIGTYVEKVFDSELSGNVIDLCPVGALTSKPFAFTSRPWELQGVESVDVLDATLPLVRVDVRGAEIMRVVPRLHEDVNEEWISDKSRFSYDGLKRQRLDVPMKRQGSEFVPISWEEALTTVANKIQSVEPQQMVAVAGDLVDAESMIALKDLFNSYNCDNLQTNEQISTSPDLRSNYLFNSTIAGVEEADVVILVGTNPRMEAPLIAQRLRKSVREHGQKVYLVGPKANLAFKHQHIGDSPRILKEIAEGKHALSGILSKAKKPLVIVGQAALNRKDTASLLSTLQQLKKTVPAVSSESWNGISFLPHATGHVTAQELGFTQGVEEPKDVKFAYLLAADEFDIDARIPKDAFVVYQGHHGDAGAARADIILPGAAYTEKSATYLSLEGRVQRTYIAAPIINQARDDWKIIRALSEVLGRVLPYDTVDAVRERLAKVSPIFGTRDVVQPTSFTEPFLPSNVGQLDETPFAPFYQNFFMTNPISRSSRVMARASQTLPTARNSYITPGNTTADKEAAKIAAGNRAQDKGKEQTNYL